MKSIFDAQTNSELLVRLGVMTDDEWENLLGIHLDHHLTQFSV